MGKVSIVPTGLETGGRARRVSAAMALHLLKLCVGVDRVSELADWQREKLSQLEAAGEPAVLRHVTRMAPQRRQEIVDGGSLYWVIKRRIQVRQRILDLTSVTTRDGVERCSIVLDPALVLTRPLPHRPCRGWRYLKAEDAPADLPSRSQRLAAEMPEELRADLLELGLL